MIIAQAPVRVSFGGGGTDLAAYYEPYGGLVVSAAIARYCYVLARPLPGDAIRITSLDYGLSETLDPAALPAPAGKLALPRAALGAFRERGLLGGGLELLLWAEVPPGTGLGSSSAMAVALALALSRLGGRGDLCPAEAAELACGLEIERMGMPIGRQDQYASAFGGLNTIYFSREGVRAAPLALPAGVADALGERLLLFATAQRRNSASILGQQQRDSADNPEVIAGLHRIKALALEMRAALQIGDLDGFGALLDRAWQLKRGLSGRISSGAIDRWYGLACEAGALGGKLTGAGGGGYLLFYCPPERQRALRDVLGREGLRELSFAFAGTGASVRAEDERDRATLEAVLRERTVAT
jgi:D-glycero-alpha-D-manno-heptose-7-phosphate kinase